MYFFYNISKLGNKYRCITTKPSDPVQVLPVVPIIKFTIEGCKARSGITFNCHVLWVSSISWSFSYLSLAFIVLILSKTVYQLCDHVSLNLSFVNVSLRLCSVPLARLSQKCCCVFTVSSYQVLHNFDLFHYLWCQVWIIKVISVELSHRKITHLLYIINKYFLESYLEMM